MDKSDILYAGTISAAQIKALSEAKTPADTPRLNLKKGPHVGEVKKDAILYVDNSLLTSLVCSTRSVLRHVHGYTSQEEQANLFSGRANHNWMAAWFKGRARLRADTEFNIEYKSWADENLPLDHRLGYENLTKIHTAWDDTHKLLDMPYSASSDHIEVAFSYPLTDDGSIEYTGRMDLIVDSLTGPQIYPEDHKFTGRLAPWLKDQYRLDSGLTGYVWACGQYVGDPRLVPGVLVNVIETSKLPDSDKMCKGSAGQPGHGVKYSECSLLHAKMELMGPFARTPAAIAEWKKSAIHLAKRYRELLIKYSDIQDLHYVRMQGTFANACGFCDFQNFCITGRPIEHIDSMLKYEPWSPFDEAHSLLARKDQQ